MIGDDARFSLGEWISRRVEHRQASKSGAGAELALKSSVFAVIGSWCLAAPHSQWMMVYESREKPPELGVPK